MKNLILSFVLLAAVLAPAQTRTDPPAMRIDFLPVDLTPQEAGAKATAFLRLIGGEPTVDVKQLSFNFYKDSLYKAQRRYSFNYGHHVVELDSVLGDVRFYSLSSYFFRPSPARAALVPPDRAQIESIVARMVRAVGVPPDARRTLFVVHDQNPRGDADTRGYFTAVYQNERRFLLQMVFDRLSGRLEMLIRCPEEAVAPSDAKPSPRRGTPPPPRR